MQYLCNEVGDAHNLSFHLFLYFITYYVFIFESCYYDEHFGVPMYAYVFVWILSLCL